MLPLGIQARTMYARPTKAMAVGETTKPATTLIDDPWAKFPLGMDVVAYVRLARNDTGGITAMLELRRGKDTGVANDN